MGMIASCWHPGNGYGRIQTEARCNDYSMLAYFVPSDNGYYVNLAIC